MLSKYFIILVVYHQPIYQMYEYKYTAQNEWKKRTNNKRVVFMNKSKSPHPNATAETIAHRCGSNRFPWAYYFLTPWFLWFLILQRRFLAHTHHNLWLVAVVGCCRFLFWSIEQSLQLYSVLVVYKIVSIVFFLEMNVYWFYRSGVNSLFYFLFQFISSVFILILLTMHKLWRL